MEAAATRAGAAVARVSKAEAIAQERVMRLLEQVEEYQRPQEDEGGAQDEEKGDEKCHNAPVGNNDSIDQFRADPQPEHEPWSPGYMTRLGGVGHGPVLPGHSDS